MKKRLLGLLVAGGLLCGVLFGVIPQHAQAATAAPLGGVQGGITCAGEPTFGNFGSVTLARTSPNTLHVTIQVTGGEPNLNLSVELWESNPNCGSDDAAATGKYLNVDSNGSGEVSFDISLPHSSLGGSVLGDGQGSEQVVISLDRFNSQTGAGDTYAMSAVSLPPVVLPDDDGDGVPNSQDDCPSQSGPVENSGCPEDDGDNDGVLDGDDECPVVAGDSAYGGCPVKKYDIKFMTFIPANYVDTAILSRHVPIPVPTYLFTGAMCSDGVSDTPYQLIFEGDDRGFSSGADATGAYRTLQAGTVAIVDKGVTTEMFMENGVATPGITEGYVKRQLGGGGALDHGVQGRIDPSDNDGVLHDCFLKHNQAPGSSGPQFPLPTVSKVSDTRARVTLTGASRNVLVRLSPDIKWNLTVDIETAGNSPQVFINGSRTQFPAYEIYVNNHPVYQFAPDNLSANQLPVLRFGLTEALKLQNYQPVRPVQTSLP